jgi:hypothetical protein
VSDVSDFLGFHPGSRRPTKAPPPDVQREEFMRGHGVLKTPTADKRRENWRGFEVSPRRPDERINSDDPAEMRKMFAYEPDPELDEILVGWTVQQLGWVFTETPQECILCGTVLPDLMVHSCDVYDLLEQRVDSDGGDPETD